jgi:hypothetical protein
MRQVILTLTVFVVAAPALATVTITAQQDYSNPCKVWIGYESDEAELIRAFALDITADHNIVEVNDYAVGDDNGGYGIFPGSFAAAPIAVNPTTGQVDNWDVAGYSPVAPSGDPDALGGIGTTGVTIEMGSLYDTAAPSQTSGILCSVTMEADTFGELCVTANAIRGNVVMESAAEVQDLVVPDGTATACGVYGGGCGMPPDQCEDWVAVGMPDCWKGVMAPSLPIGIPNPSWAYQCDGDADGGTETFFKYRVFGNDLAAVVDNWKKKAGDHTLNPCADFDHKAETFFKYRVFGNDLAIVVENWKKKASELPGNCPRPG